MSPEFAWAMGLFEGEGCITHTSPVAKSGRKNLRLLVRMTDEDVIKRFGAIVGCGSVHGPYPRAQAHHKPIWAWQVTGQVAMDLLVSMRPHLGARRAAIADSWIMS